MFIEDLEKRAAVCQAILQLVGLVEPWTAAGPGPGVVQLARARESDLPPAQRAGVLLAFALWNGEGGLTVADMVIWLDAEHLAAIGSLFVTASYGAEGIDGWLAEYGPAMSHHHR